MGKPRAFTDQQEAEEIAPKYQAGATIAELAAEYGVTTPTISHALERCGVGRRFAGPQRHKRYARPGSRLFNEAQERELARLYNEGAFVPELALERGVSRKAVMNALARQKVQMRDKVVTQEMLMRRRREEGRPYPNWKGGRTLGQDGYVRVAIAPDDPMWGMATYRRRRSSHGHAYVLEHRLAMARHLGRPLMPDETVHHKNGVRDDNRIENLELYVGRHGKGASAPHCRTCSCFAL